MGLLVHIRQLQYLVTQVYKSFPKEASGLIVAKEIKGYLLLSFVATSSHENTISSFRIKDEEIDNIQKNICNTESNICGCFHSHILSSATPSKYDIRASKQVNDLWLIYSVKYVNFRIYKWDGMQFHRVGFRIINETK